MTDALTDAVRRLKELQQDVERLKSGENEEGQPRILFSAQEAAEARDSAELNGPQFLTEETAVADDESNLKGPDETQIDIATASDASNLQGRDIVAGSYNQTGYRTSFYDTTLERLIDTQKETATGSGSLAIKRNDIATVETAAAIDQNTVKTANLLETETVTADDDVVVDLFDIVGSETAAAIDQNSVKTANIAEFETAAVNDSGVVTEGDVLKSENAVADERVNLQGRQMSGGTYGSAGYNTAAYQ